MLRDEIRKEIETWDISLIVELSNDYNEKMNQENKLIYNMENFDYIFINESPTNILTMINQGSFSIDDNWFIMDEMYLNSYTDDTVKNIIDLDEIIDYIMDNETWYHDTDIETILKRG